MCASVLSCRRSTSRFSFWRSEALARSSGVVAPRRFKDDFEQNYFPTRRVNANGSPLRFGAGALLLALRATQPESQAVLLEKNDEPTVWWLQAMLNGWSASKLAKRYAKLLQTKSDE